MERERSEPSTTSATTTPDTSRAATSRNSAQSLLRGRDYAAQTQMLTPRSPVQRMSTPVQREEGKTAEEGIAAAEGAATAVGGPGAADTSPWGKVDAEPSGKGYFDYDPMMDDPTMQIGRGPETVPETEEEPSAPAPKGGAKPKAGAASKPKAGAKKPAGNGAAKKAGGPTSPTTEVAPTDEAPPVENADEAENVTQDGIAGTGQVGVVRVPIGGSVQWAPAFKWEPKKEFAGGYLTLQSVAVKGELSVSIPGEYLNVTRKFKTEGKRSGGTTTGKNSEQVDVAFPAEKLLPSGETGVGNWTAKPKAGIEWNDDQKNLVVGYVFTNGSWSVETKFYVGYDVKDGVILGNKASGKFGFNKPFTTKGGIPVKFAGTVGLELDLRLNGRKILEKLAQEAGKRFATTAPGAAAPGVAAGAAPGAAAPGAAAGGVEVAETGLGAVGGGEMAFAAGLMTIPATMFLGMAMVADDLNERKLLQTRANEAAASCIAGYLGSFNVSYKGGGDLAFSEEGAKRGLAKRGALIRASKAAYEKQLAEGAEGEPWNASMENDTRETIFKGAKEAGEPFVEGVKAAFYDWVVSSVFSAWEAKYREGTHFNTDGEVQQMRNFILGGDKLVTSVNLGKADRALAAGLQKVLSNGS